MKILRSVSLAVGLLAVIAAAPAASIRVPQAQINAENARWRALGVKIPPGGIVLAHPYAAPYSNRSFVVPYPWYAGFAAKLRKHNDVPVDAAALRSDLPVLRFVLEKAYAGYKPAAERGWNWNTMFRQWDAALARDGHRLLPLKDAFAPWGRLERAASDNHSGVIGFSPWNSTSASAQLAREANGACTQIAFAGGGSERISPHDAAQQPHAVRAWDGSRMVPAWYVSYPKVLGAARSIRCGAQTIMLDAIAHGAAIPATPVYRTLAPGIAYLRLPTFTAANNAALRKTLSTAAGLGKERLVVFDMRGNAGGSMPSDVLANWFAESAIENADSMTQIGTNSCFASGLSFGFQQQLLGTIKPPAASGLQQALQQIVDELKGSATPNCEVDPQVKTADPTLRDHRFHVHADLQGQTRVVVLVDAGCSGECEYMTYILGNLPGTVIAGSSTAGDLGYTQPGYFVLPNSRVPFEVPLVRNEPYGDGRSIDGYGLSVDVLLPTAQSQSAPSLAALAKALAGH